MNKKDIIIFERRADMKVLKSFSRVIISAIVVVLALVAILTTLFIPTSINYIIEMSILGFSTSALMCVFIPGINAIFGGSGTATYSTTINGEISEESYEFNFENLAFDYVTLIALIVVLLGVILFVCCYRNKKLCLLSLGLQLIGICFVAAQSGFFGIFNADFIANQSVTGDALNGLGSADFSTSIIGVGSIIGAVCLSVGFIFSMVHTLIMKDKK